MTKTVKHGDGYEALSKEQISTLYKVSAGHLRDHLLIRFAFEHAMRATEVCRLQVRDFDATTDTVYLHLQRLKGSEFTVQPLMPTTAALLLDYIKGKGSNDYLFPKSKAGRKAGNKPLKSGEPRQVKAHLTRVRFFQLFRDYCRMAGIPSHLAHPHAAKHGLASAVINEIGIQATRTIRSTQAYLHSSDASASAAVHAVLGAGL